MSIKKHLIKDEQNYYHFRINRKDMYEALRYRELIENYTKKKKPIPNKVLQKFFDFFYWIEQELDEAFNQDINSICDKVFDYFKSLKSYSKIDLQELVNETVVYLYKKRINSINLIKRDFIHTCYKFIEANYPVLSHFQISYLTAYITIVFDYPMSNSINKMRKEGMRPTTDELYQSIKSPVKKFKKNP